MFDTILQQLFNGLTIGFAYAIIAAGLALIFGLMRIVNFAHGALFMMAAYGLVLCDRAFGWSYAESCMFVIVCAIAVGFAMQVIFIEKLMKSYELNSLLGTFALSLMIQYTMSLTVGSSGIYVDTPLDEVIALGPVVATGQKIAVVVFGIAMFAVLTVLLNHSTIGRLMRGCAQNRYAALVSGVNVKGVERLTFVLGVVLAAAGGVLIAPLAPITPGMGASLTIKAFALIVVGGLGSVPGAIIAGLLLGVVEALVAGYVSGAWKDAVAYGVLLALLLARPEGLARSGGTP